MGTINVTSKRTGNTYPIAISGNQPNQQEDVAIQKYIDTQDGIGQVALPEVDDSQGGLIDFVKSTAGGFGQSFAQIPGGITALGESIGGYDVGTTGIGKAAQSFSNDASAYIREATDMNESVSSKSGQAIGSLLSFLVPSTIVAKTASVLGGGAKLASGLALSTAATQGAAITSQDQMNRIASFIEGGGELDEETKRDAVQLSGLLGTSEAAPLVPLLKHLGTAMRILKKVPAGKVDDALRTIGGKLKRSLIAGIGEGSQELLAGLVQDMIEKNLYNPDLEVGQSAYDDAVYGGGAGAALNLIVDSIRGRQLKKFDKQYKQLDEDQQEEGKDASVKLQNATNFINSRKVLQLPPPAEKQDGIVVDENFDKDQKLIDFGEVVNDQTNLQKEIKKQEEANQTLEAVKELKSPYIPVKLTSLPQEESFKIRKQRIELGKATPVDDPASLQEIEDVVGIESANRERANQKPILSGQQKKEDLFPELEGAEEKALANKFTNTILKAKVINRAEVKRIAARINKEKMSNKDADNVLDTLLKKGALEYTPPIMKKGKIVKAGKYTARVVEEAPSKVDMESQALGLTELAKQNIEARKTVEDLKSKSLDDAIQTETYNQQLEILTKEFSDLQRFAFDLENQANKIDSKQDKIKASNIVPNYVAKKAFDNSAELEKTEQYRLKQKRVMSALRRELARVGLTDVYLDDRNLIDENNLERSINLGEASTSITEGTFDVSKDGQRVIALAMELYNPNMSDLELQRELSGVMNHEIIHALKNLGLFSNKEYVALENAVSKRKYVKIINGKKEVREYTYLDRATRMHSNPKNNNNLSQDQIVEEAIAEMYRDYASGKLSIAGRPKTLLDKIVKFIKSIFITHNSEGFKDIDSIFDNIQTTNKEKQIGRRARQNATSRDYLDVDQSETIRSSKLERLPDLHLSSLGPLDKAQKAKAAYLASKNITPRRQDKYITLNVELAKKIANDFDLAIDDPYNPDVIESYNAMNDETFDQWQFVKATGLKVEMIKPNQLEPYPNGAKDMLNDLHNNNHMWVYPSDFGFGQEAFTEEDVSRNPLLKKTGEIIDGTNARYNDIFRIVHDYFGHGLEGATFSARGEENAWQAHVRMYSPLAAKAMTTETRGQNSWVNYSEAVGEQNRNSKNKAEETVYADQKVTLLSNFVMEEGLANDMEAETNEQALRRSQQFNNRRDDPSDRGRLEGRGRGQTDVLGESEPLQERSEPQVTKERTITLTHFSPVEGLNSIDPEKQQSNLYMRGAERRRTYSGYPARNYYAINIADPEGYNPENNVGDNIYEIEVPYDDMYDWAKDEKGFNAKANKELEREAPTLRGEGRLGYITTAMERMIKESGASGYWSKSSGRGFTAAMFNELNIPQTYQPQKYTQAYKDKINQKRGENATRLMRSSVMAIGQEHTISTRFPTAKNSLENPINDILLVNGDAIRQDPKLASQAANLIKGYNISENTKLYENFSDLEIIEDYIESMRSNLLYIYDSIDPEIRNRSSKWYDGARVIIDRFSNEYGYKPEVIAAVMSAQSPQKDWFMNVSLSERMLDITKNFGNTQFTPEMMVTAKRIFGKDKYKAALNHISNTSRNSTSLNNLDHSLHKAMWIRIFDETYNDRGHRIITPEGEFLNYALTGKGAPKKTGWGSLSEMSKAVSVMEDGSIENISIQMGNRHKIRSFFNNLITPNSKEGHSTIDTHAVAAAHFKPLSGKALEVDHNFGAYTGGKKEGRAAKYGTIPSSSVSGSKGTYGLVADAYARAANDRGVLPRQMQSITWEAIRGLYTNTFKSNPQKVAQIENIWNRYKEGRLTIDEARQEAIDATPAGFEEPSWARPDNTVSEFSGNSSYERELSRSNLSGRDSGDDSGVRGISPRESEIRRSSIRASTFGATQREGIAIKNDIAIEKAQQNIRYNNLSGIIAKGLGILPEKIKTPFGEIKPLFGRTAIQAADRIVTKYQDSFQPIGKMMDELRNNGYTIADAADTFLQEKNSHGITGSKLDEVEKTLIKPLMEEIKQINVTEDQINNLSVLSATAAGLTGQEGFVKSDLETSISPLMTIIDSILYARHAKERNAKINADYGKGMGSGMSFNEATAILDWVASLNESNRKAVTNSIMIVKEITENTNVQRYESGLITKETFEKRNDFKNYVPLRGDMDSDQEFKDDKNQSLRKTTNLFGAMGNEDRSAKGRGLKYAQNILGSALAQNQRAIDRGERNKVGLSFLKLIKGEEAQPDGTVAINAALASDMSKTIAFEAKKDAMNAQQFTIKEDGQEVHVNIYSSSIARSLKLHSEPQTNMAFIRMVGKLNRWLSSVNTTYNPAFVLPNLAKDLETALVNVQQYDMEGITKEITLNTGKAILGIRNVLRKTKSNTLDDNSYWAQEYIKFVKSGGKNATNMMSTVQDQMANMKNLLNEIGGTKNQGLIKGNFKKMLKFLDDYNTAVENGVRVATFTALKKRGFSDARAAEAARDVTVNFAKGGEDKVAMNSLYLFYNASLQGSMALLTAARRSKRVRKLWLGMVAYGLLQDQFVSFLSDDEDENGRKQYDDLDDYTLEHNLIFPSLGLSDEKFIKIPLAYGLNMAVNLGRSLSRYTRGEYTLGQTSSSIFNTTMETLSPFGAIENWQTYATPTFADPAIELFINKNYRQAPIYKESPMYASSPRPDSQQYWGNTGAIPKAVVDIINTISGGDEVESGFIDMSPDVLEYWIEFAIGGAGATVNRLGNLVFSTVPDVLSGEFEGNLEQRIPFVRKLIASPSERVDTSTYLENRKGLYTIFARLELASRKGDANEVRGVRAKYADELSIYGRFKAIDNARNRLLRQIRELERNLRIPDETRTKLIKLRTEKIQGLMKTGVVLMRQVGLKEQ